jgi:hypothetical protein
VQSHSPAGPPPPSPAPQRARYLPCICFQTCLRMCVCVGGGVTTQEQLQFYLTNEAQGRTQALVSLSGAHPTSLTCVSPQMLASGKCRVQKSTQVLGAPRQIPEAWPGSLHRSSTKPGFLQPGCQPWTWPPAAPAPHISR